MVMMIKKRIIPILVRGLNFSNGQLFLYLKKTLGVLHSGINELYALHLSLFSKPHAEISPKLFELQVSFFFYCFLIYAKLSASRVLPSTTTNC